MRSEDPYSIVPSRDENGHGSILAGVAAGSVVRQGNPYIGAAPGADIVVVKLKECKQYLRSFYLVPEGVPAYQENDIMLGIKYAESFVRLFERPVVICLGLGTTREITRAIPPCHGISLPSLSAEAVPPSSAGEMKGTPHTITMED